MRRRIRSVLAALPQFNVRAAEVEAHRRRRLLPFIGSFYLVATRALHLGECGASLPLLSAWSRRTKRWDLVRFKGEPGRVLPLLLRTGRSDALLSFQFPFLL